VTHLRRYLEHTGALPPDHLDMAVRRQQIYGGSLDTVLLELELVDPHTLGELLVQACGLPLAPFALIDDERDRPWHALPSDVLDIGWAVPLVMHGEEIWIAVHPDLPNERLGAIYRMVPGVNPFVIPECALEKIAAERASSVVPQRYAVLCVAYLSALRRRPSVSDISFPMLHDIASASMQLDVEAPSRRGTLVPDADLTPGPILLEPDAGSIPEDEFDRRPTMVFEPSRVTFMPQPPPPPPPVAAVESSRTPTLPPDLSALGPAIRDDDVPGDSHLTLRVAATPAASGAATVESPWRPPPLPDPVDRTQTTIAAPSVTRDDDAAPIILTPTAPIVGGPPPVRFTSRGTMIATPKDAEAQLAQAELERRLARARDALTSATTRDAVLTALAEAIALLGPRTALLRVRNREVVGLSTPQSGLEDPAGKVVPIGATGLLARVQADGRYVGFVDDEVFATTFCVAKMTPCLVRRVDVAGRPTLVAYVDRAGEAFSLEDPSILDELCAIAGRALEIVVKLRRDHGDDSGVRMSPLSPPPQFGTTQPSHARASDEGSTALPTTEVPWRAPRPDSVPDLIVTDVPPPPPRMRTLVDGSPRRPAPNDPPRSTRPTLAIDSPPLDSFDPVVASERVTEPYEPERSSASGLPPPPESGVPETARGQLLTIHAMPPPPPLPPPPPMMASESQSRPLDTLMGLPPPVSSHDTRPRFVPPPLDDRENSGIIPLSSPIDQPSMRGRIELDDEDWSHPGRQLPSESMQHQVDVVLRSISAGGGNIAELRAMGEPALLRLAAQFPGPLEVLRRDLRALPPPSAHGPLVRTAILLGGDFVPHLVDLFDHPSPDVRFYAAFVFQELRDPRAMRPLSELAFDTSGDVRVISMRVLETYSRIPGFADAVRVVRAQLDSTNRTRQLYASRAVGTLRDIDGIPKLVDMLSSRDRFVQEAALESLCSITGQQLGLKPHRWKTWYAENEHRHRIEWIIESLRHRDVPVRRWAADELTRVTGHREPFSAMGDKKARDIAVEAWTEWWEQRGRAQLTGQGAPTSAPQTGGSAEA
jgi:hypothetical protein